MTELLDALVVGGGINGAGIARDLVGKGLSVALVERDDLAQHTSSSSTKLIHGGLRYLEYYEFALVRKALQEREVLMRMAPHIIWPLRFLMPHEPSMRHQWMIRAGLFLYDNLAKRELLAASAGVNLRKSPLGEPLKERYSYGFEYSDGWVDDARLVVLNAMDARERGARVLTHCKCVSVERVAGRLLDISDVPEVWRAKLEHADGREETVLARAVVNAAGPWAASFLQTAIAQSPQASTKSLRLVKGSHMVVKRMFAHEHAYIFQNDDKRIMFAIPYERDFTLIGTTDVEIKGEPEAARMEHAEVGYLCKQANHYFKRAVQPSDVVWTYAGVRPLLDDASGDAAAVTRDYLLESAGGIPGANKDKVGESRGNYTAPLLNVWGGKITTFRRLAEEAAELVCKALGYAVMNWTADAPLPGGDLSALVRASGDPRKDIAAFAVELQALCPSVSKATIARWTRSYGSLALKFAERDDLGKELAPGLFEAELEYLRKQEFAQSALDILWRRSKLGLHYSVAERERLGEMF